MGWITFVFVSLLSLINRKEILAEKSELLSKRESSSFLLKEDHALSFLRNKRWDNLRTHASQLRQECCNGNTCDYEERREIPVGWNEIDRTMCEIGVREDIPCRCKAKDGSFYECGSHLIRGPLCPSPCKEFDCNNGRVCTAYVNRCDSKNDCGNWNDESGCSRTKYSAAEVKASLSLNPSNKFYGTVNVFGKAICDDNWTDKNADVVCRSFDLPSGTRGIGWGNEPVSGNFFMDDVVCSGSEYSLVDCQHKTYHNCGPSEGAAAICLVPSAMKLMPSNSGNGKNEGSVFFENIPICATQWSRKEAQIVCNHLYYDEFKISVPVYSYQTNTVLKSPPLFLTSLNCSGTEKLLTQCQMAVTKSCTYIASVQCARCSPSTLMNIVKEIKIDGSISEVYQSAEAATKKLTEICRDWNCNDSNPVYPEFCQVKAFLSNIKRFTKPKVNDNIVTLYRDTDYFGLLNYNFLKGSFETIRSDIDTLGETFSNQLGEYFGKLAKFDKQRATTDKDNAIKDWSKLKSRSEEASSQLGNQLTEIIQYAIGVSSADLLSKLAVLAIRILGSANPIKWLANPDASIIDQKDALSEVAKQHVLIEQLKYVRFKSIPKLDGIVKRISQRLNENKNTFEAIRRFIETVEQGKEFTNEQLDNYVKYSEQYSQAITLSDIAEYGATLNEIVEKLCEVVENPDTELGTIPAGIAAHKGLCPDAKISTAVLVALYEEIAEQETVIIESFSKFARAALAEDAANKLANSMKGTSGDQLRKLLTKYEALHLIRYHKIALIKSACDYVTYMNHGVEKQVCKDLLDNPSGDPGVLINTVQFPMCECLNCHIRKGEFLIPATMTGENNTIDLSTLYSSEKIASEEFTKGLGFLKIPNKDWLLENQWISNFDQGPFFLKNLNIHLPPALNFTHEINMNIVLLDNQLKGKNYWLEGGVFIKNIYTENKLNERSNPYNNEPCNKKLSTFSLDTEGNIYGKLLPRLDGSRWRIELRSNHLLPKIFTTTKLFLKASAEFCFQSRLLSRVKQGVNGNNLSDETSSEMCCNSKMFTDQIFQKKHPHQNPCKLCPEASASRLNGYFCEKCPPGYEPNYADNFGCSPCPKNKFKSEAGQFACESCADGKTSSEGALHCY